MNSVSVSKSIQKVTSESITVKDKTALLSFLREKGTNENTLKSYLGNIVKFYGFYYETFKKSPLLATRDDINGYVKYLEDLYERREIGPSVFNTRLACVSSFYKVMYKQGATNVNVAANLPRKRSAKKVKTPYISKDEVRKILNTVDKDTYPGSLHYALLITYFTTGARQSAIADLRVTDIHMEDSNFVIQKREKGGIYSEVMLSTQASWAIQNYLGFKSRAGDLENNDFLFSPTVNNRTKNKNRRLSSEAINKIFKKYAKKAGLNINIYCHTSRVHFITTHLEEGEDLYRVAQAVDHLDPRTTAKYHHLKESRSSLSSSYEL